MAQLPLELRLKPHASFSGFVPGPNAPAAEHLRAVAAGSRAESIWIYGAPRTGKSHLLAAACREAGSAGRRAIYLALGPDSDPTMLGELDSIDLVALDDLHRVAGVPAWERALFSIFNARLEAGGIVAAAATSPRECEFRLPDLASRAAATAVYRLDYLDDDDLLAALLRHAELRGLEIDEAAARYLLSRLSRDLVALTDCLDRIDRHALAAQRPVTIPLLREVVSS